MATLLAVLILGPFGASLTSASAPPSARAPEYVQVDTPASTIFTGGLMAMSLDAPQGSSASFQLSAARITIVAISEPTAPSSLVDPGLARTTERHDLARASGSAFVSQPDGSLLVLGGTATPQVVARMGPAAIRAEAATSVLGPSVSGSPSAPEERSVEQALNVDARDGFASMTVRGDFEVVLWGWDGYAYADHDAASLASGPASATEPAALAGEPMDSAREVELLVSNGTLDLGPSAGTEARLWLDAGTVGVDQGAIFAEQKGGAATTLARPGGSLLMRAESGLVQVDDQPAAARSAVTSGARPSPWSKVSYVAVGASVIASSTVAGVEVHRRLEARRFDRLDTAHAEGDLAETLRLSDRLLQSKDFGEDAGLLRFEALLRLGRFEEAQILVQGFIEHADPKVRPALDFMDALLLSLRGDDDSASKALASCLGTSDEFYDAVMDHPLFAAARQSPAVRAALAKITDRAGRNT